MFVLKSHITIGALEFDFVIDIKIVKTWKQLTQTAILKFPRNIVVRTSGDDYSNKSLNEVIKKGDAVTIKLGYGANMQTEFTGYVAYLKPNTPIEIQCEDEMWKLKQTTVKKSWKSVNLKTLVAEIAPDYQVNVLDIELGSFVINEATPAKVLNELKESYGLTSFFKDGVLNVGFPYAVENDRIKYHFQGNIREDKINLEYKNADDIKLKVKAISILPSNKKIEVEIGDETGETRTMTYYNIKSESELKKIANAEIDKLKVDGFSGHFGAYGVPYADHGDVAELVDKRNDKAGDHFIDKVVIDFGQSGFIRSLYIGKRA